jgi:hypothetical protein
MNLSKVETVSNKDKTLSIEVNTCEINSVDMVLISYREA